MKNMKQYGVMILISVLVFIVLGAFIKPVQNVIKEVAVGGSSAMTNTENCTGQGGMTRCHYYQSFNASSTVCSILAPREIASSTLLYVGVRQITATTAPQIIEVGRATIAGATTTLLTRGTSAASVTSVFGTTTVATNATLPTFRGGIDYLNVKFGGSDFSNVAGYGGAQAIKGVCDFVEFDT